MPIAQREVPPPKKRSKRKERYKADKDYRNKAKDQSRAYYRNLHSVELKSCLYSLEFIDKVATLENVVLPDNTTRSFFVLNISQTADILQRLYQTLWRWVQNEIVPAPVLKTVPNSKLDTKIKSMRAYHVDEVRVLVEEIGKHEQELVYLRRDHKQVRMRIAQRIQDVRKALKIER